MVSYEAGTKVNCIPRSATAVVTVSDFCLFKLTVNACWGPLKSEYAHQDKEIRLVLEQISPSNNLKDDISFVCNTESTLKIMDFISCWPNGVVRMNPSLVDAIDTSTSHTIGILNNESFVTRCFCRSTIDSHMDHERQKYEAICRVSVYHIYNCRFFLSYIALVSIFILINTCPNVFIYVSDQV